MNQIFMLFISAILLSSCGSGENSFNLDIPGIQGPKVQLTKNSLNISLVAEEMITINTQRYDIPHYTRSHIEFAPDLHSSGTRILLKLAAKDLISTPLAKIENQPLPGGKSGKLPAVAFSTEQIEGMIIFQDKNELAIWIPLQNIDLTENILSSNYYSNSHKVGTLALVGKNQNGESAGMLLKLNIQL